MTATATLHPATVDDVQHAVREAAAARHALRLVGRGSWLHAGRPVQAEQQLELRALSGIVEYVPGDLTLTAMAGTPLRDLHAAVRAEGQWLPLDPWGGDEGSLGATLATATAGPLSGALGLPRDVVLGVAFVTGTGELVRGGGRVVKNVAGFDLVRLAVGAWGTLGALTEATVRLRALPEVDETVALLLPDTAALAEWLAALRRAPLAPAALELVGGAATTMLALGDAPVLLARLGGNAANVAAQRATLASLGDVATVEGGVWDRLRTLEPRDAAVVRYSSSPSRLATVWAHALAVAARAGAGAAIHASAARGVVRVILPAMEPTALEAALGPTVPGITRIHERLPAALWPRLAPSAVGDRLSPLVRRAFDPHHLLNPGILGPEPTAGTE